MIKYISLVALLLTNIFSFSISSNDNYKIFDNEKYSIIYSAEYKNEAKFIKDNIDNFLEINNKSFSFTFDEPLKIVLVSNKIQIANAFSTQTPFNMGVYYNGGSSKNDYFASNSWLTTLFIHEMIHNYQLNAKKSKISKTLHKYLGNNAMPIMAVVPFFTLPNYLLPTVLLEGNAVLNESIYSNGGRLHNGTLNALKNALIFDDKIDDTRLINDHLDFPYTNEKYIVGGFYMQYLSLKYGLDKVNSFFYEHSIHSINPLLLNSTFKSYFGVSFKKTIGNFVKFTKTKYNNFKIEKVVSPIATSKAQVSLSKIGNKIYFITSDLKSDKYLYILDTNTDKFTFEQTTLNNDKIFKKNNTLYTASSSFISPKLLKQGLFDKDNYILKDTSGKAIQSLHKNKTAYINTKESFLETKLYINGKFYSNISSSSLFDNDGNIYYFKQKDEKRILYKNKTAIFTIDGYFSKLVEIINNEIFFIANTSEGSSLYKLSNNNIYRLANSDNIINAKIINNTNALVVSVESNTYKIHKITLDNTTKAQVYYEKGLANTQKLVFKKEFKNNNIFNYNYNEFAQLQYSYLHPSFIYDSVNGSSYNINASFTDPLMFNEINAFAIKENNDSLAGLSYTNTRRLPFSLIAYDINRETKRQDDRGYGLSIKIFDTLYKKGRHTINSSLQLFFDDKDKDKKPLILTLNHNYSDNFYLEDSAYFSSDLNLIIKNDSSYQTFVLDYKINKHLISEFYANAQIKSIYNTSDNYQVEIVDSYTETMQDNTKEYVQGIENDFYVKGLTKLSLGFSKTFHFSKYFPSFPLSLRKESIFTKYNLYNLDSQYQSTIREKIVGLKFDILLIHKLPIPIIVKYIQSNGLLDNNKVILEAGMTF